MTTSSARVSIPALLSRKRIGPKIVSLTAYDYTFARLIDEAQVDLILVGDSLSCVVQGNDTTLPVTLDEMIYHCRCVSRGVKRALVVGDLPFLSYQISPEQALLSAGRMIKEGGVQAVKLEGGVVIADTIKRIVDIDIPVVAHIGLTPQSYHRMGGNKIQGKKAQSGKGSRQQVLQDALAVTEAGASLLVLESIPRELAAEITEKVEIPTIGIGAGPECDGQILVTQDMLGFDPNFTPRFLKHYANFGEQMLSAIANYRTEVIALKYPSEQNSFSDPATLKAVKRFAK